MSVSRFQYPAQTTAYKVKVKHGDDWKLHDTCCLDISVGKNYHEGVKLEATIGWAQHRFKHVAVAVNDTLQRFNAMFTGGMTEAEAAELARQKGDEWILRNKEILINCHLTRSFVGTTGRAVPISPRNLRAPNFFTVTTMNSGRILTARLTISGRAVTAAKPRCSTKRRNSA